MRLIDADRLLSDEMKSKYYHLPNGDIAIPLIDIEHAPTIGGWVTTWDNKRKKYVTHWMPLPEPPEEDEHESLERNRPQL